MTKKLILTYQHHRQLGAIIQPAIATKEENKTFYHLTPVIPETNDEEIPTLNAQKKLLLAKCFEYGERNIYQFFNKKKDSQISFYQNISNDYLKEHIRPYIDKRIHQVIQLAISEEVSIYLKQSNNVFENDLLYILPEPLTCAYHFDYDGSLLKYELNLFNANKKIRILNQRVHLLSESPAIFIINDKICFANNFNSKQIIPFVSKTHITIPEKMVSQYLNSFVKKTLIQHKVTATGIPINIVQTKPKAKLTLEHGINEQLAINLEFLYDKYTIRSDNKKQNALVFFDEPTKSFTKIERNNSWEEDQIAYLRNLNLIHRSGTLYMLKQTIENIDLITWINQNTTILTEQSFIIENNLNTEYYLGEIELEMHTEESLDWFDVRAEITFGKFTIPFVKLRNNILKGIREYTLPDGTVAILPKEWYSKYTNLLGMCKVEGAVIKVHKYQFGVLRNMSDGISESFIERFDKLIKSDATYEIPEEINAQLRNYQVDGYGWMRDLHELKFGGCLADDMGLGKTIQTIGLLTFHHLHDKTKCTEQEFSESSKKQQLDLFEEELDKNIKKATSLIIAPSSLVHNWINEIKKFSPKLKVTEHSGSSRSQNIYRFKYFDLIITSLGVVRNDIEKLKTFRFDYIVIDESQNIKNPDSISYKSVIQLQSDHKLVLTGTPIENSLKDLWAQLNFINPGMLGSIRWFMKHYVTPIEKNRDEEKLLKLKQLTAPFILRRAKSEVAKDLPELAEQTITCDMHESQSKLYEERKSIARNALLNVIQTNEMGKNSTIILNSLNTLRQIANNPLLIDENYKGSSGKTEIVRRHLENLIAENHKVLVFSSFVKHLEVFEAICKENSWGYKKLTGQVPQKTREKIINDFQNNDNTHIFLISLKAGGVGLNLTAADYVMVLDPWWNPAAEAQAINRAHRIGQQKNVMVYRYISENSIEEKIRNLQNKKQLLSDELIEDKVALKNLTTDEIKSLFE